jgi:hypothetical protein
MGLKEGKVALEERRLSAKSVLFFADIEVLRNYGG